MKFAQLDPGQLLVGIVLAVVFLVGLMHVAQFLGEELLRFVRWCVSFKKRLYAVLRH